MLKPLPSLLNLKTSGVGSGLAVVACLEKMWCGEDSHASKFEHELLQTLLEAIGSMLQLVYLLCAYYMPDTLHLLP